MLNLPGCLQRSAPAVMCTDASILCKANLKKTWMWFLPFLSSSIFHCLYTMNIYQLCTAIFILCDSTWLLEHCDFWCNGILTPSPKLCVNTSRGDEQYLCCSPLLCESRAGASRQRKQPACHCSLISFCSSWLCSGRWTHTHLLSSSSTRTVSTSLQNPTKSYREVLMGQTRIFFLGGGCYQKCLQVLQKGSHQGQFPSCPWPPAPCLGSGKEVQVPIKI